RDLRRHVAGVEDAAGLVALQFRGRAVALAGDVAFRDRPACASDAVHGASNSSAGAQAASTKKPRHCGRGLEVGWCQPALGAGSSPTKGRPYPVSGGDWLHACGPCAPRAVLDLIADPLAFLQPAYTL